MKRRLFTSTVLAMGVLGPISIVTGFARRANAASALKNQALPILTVFRSPTCGCCEDWVAHVKAAGFDVSEHVTEDMDGVKTQYGVPERLSSCHTALAQGYFIEGHVPAVEVKRLLNEQPEIAGIAVPGMPMGSPGMEQGDRVDPFVVVALDKSGGLSLFADYR
ncbi:MAG: DUF411 domain-containing protein [Cyanobacteria bacterium J06627_28]